MTTAALVLLSIAVLAIAPGLSALLAKSPALAQLLDSFTLVAVGGIVALHVVPQSAELAGSPAVGAALVGLVLPIALHRVDAGLVGGAHDAGRSVRNGLLLGVLAAGIFVHGIFDGTALAGVTATRSLALAVLLHRLPAGIALWTVVKPKVGLRRMLIVAGAYATGTAFGGAVGDVVLAGASVKALAMLQALVAGSILHIVAESAPFVRTGSRPPLGRRVLGVAGAALAVLALFFVSSAEEAHGEARDAIDASTALLGLALRTAPALLLSFVVVGVLTALYPDGAPGIRGRGNRVVDAALGVAAGLPHPLCSCTVAPLYSSLVDNGAPPAAARAFLVATPELGVPAVLVTARLFGLPFTALRVVGAAVLAFLVGLSAVGARSSSPSPSSTGALGPRLLHGLRHGFVDAFDHVGPWMVLGLGAAALLEPALDEGALAGLPALVVIAGAALASLPLYLCAAGITPVAAMLVHKGAPLGAALAMMLVGPATSMPTLALLKRKHGTSAAVGFAALVVVGAIALGLGVQLAPAGLFDAPFDVHGARDGANAGVVELASLAVLCALGVTSLLRQGVRGFLVQIMSPQHSHADDHDHGPGCAHDHGPPVDVIRSPLVGAPRAVARVALSFDPRGGAP